MRAPKSLLAFLLVAMTCAGQEAQDPKPPPPSSPSAPAAEFASAELLLRQGKYDEAIAELQNLATKNPVPKNLVRELGAALRRGAAVGIVLPDHPAPGRDYSDDALRRLREEAPEAVEERRLVAFCLGLALHGWMTANRRHRH